MKPDQWNEELRRDAPTLHGLPKSDPFVVEQGFFDRFPHEVQALATKPARTSWRLWLKRTAVALPALAVLIFTLHSLQPTAAPVADEASYDDLLYSSVADQMGTDEVLENADADDWPEFTTVTLQLSTDEALAYVDHNQIDLNEYLY